MFLLGLGVGAVLGFLLGVLFVMWLGSLMDPRNRRH